MKPNDLDDPSPVEPDDALLDRVRTRSGAYRRRQRAQRFVSAGATALIVVLAVTVALSVGGGNGPKPSGPASTTTTTVPGVTAADLEGEWVLPESTKPSTPSITFERSGRFAGDDGCNGIGGTYQIEGTSTTFEVYGTTDVLCRPKPVLLRALQQTRRSELRSGHLVLIAENGDELAELVRPVVTARIELPADTLVAGSTMKGRLVVDNETGRVIKAQGCGSLFAVALSNATYTPDLAWTTCLQELDVPTGVSTYPVLVMASTMSCTNGPPSDGIPTCSPPNTPPALPPGRYEATLYQSAHVVPDPAPVRIEVVASS